MSDVRHKSFDVLYLRLCAWSGEDLSGAWKGWFHDDVVMQVRDTGLKQTI